MTTLAEIRTEIRQRCDMERSQFIKDAEFTTMINRSYAELYDLLVSRFEDYFIGDPTLYTISQGSNEISLPANFYKLASFERNISGDYYYPLMKFNMRDRSRFRSPLLVYRRELGLKYRIVGNKIIIEPSDRAAGDYRLYFVPSFTALVNDSDVIDTVITRNSWEEYIVCDVAVKALGKEESDPSLFIGQKAAIMKRIEEMAQNRDMQNTQSVTDVYQDGYDQGLWDY